MVYYTGVASDPTRGARPARAVEDGAVEDGDGSSGESRFDVVRAMCSPARSPVRSPVRSPARRSRRDSRNVAVALALLGFAVIMFPVTIVKFEEQMHGNDMSQTGESQIHPAS